MPCHRMMLALSRYRLLKTQTGWRAPSMGVAGDVFGEEQRVRTSHRRRPLSRLCSPCSRLIARSLISGEGAAPL
jgi:hypothetical protein